MDYLFVPSPALKNSVHDLHQSQSGTAPVVQFIERAHGQLGIEVYYLTSKPILGAINGAVQRGVAAFAIVDGRPYRMSRKRVRKEIAAIAATGAKVEAAPARFEGTRRFDHAKYAVTNGPAIIGTANWDWSAFHRNREYLDTTDNPAVVKSLEAIFRADWLKHPAGDKPRHAAPDLVLSPGAEPKLAAVIDQPGPVEIETEELGDDPAIIKVIAAKGGQARVIFPMTLSNADRDRVDELRKAGVQVRFLPRHPFYMHAKMITGGTMAFIGSQNFSGASLDRNREIGIVLHEAAARTKLIRQFNHDWSDAVKP